VELLGKSELFAEDHPFVERHSISFLGEVFKQPLGIIPLLAEPPKGELQVSAAAEWGFL
jgi:hypothetical protein